MLIVFTKCFKILQNVSSFPCTLKFVAIAMIVVKSRLTNMRKVELKRELNKKNENDDEQGNKMGNKKNKKKKKSV